MNLGEIRKYIEEKYGVDLSQIRVAPRWRCFCPSYRFDAKVITYPKAYISTPLALGLLSFSIVVGNALAALISAYLLAFSACLEASKLSDISHEYSHAAHHERIERYFSLLRRSGNEARELESKRLRFHLYSKFWFEILAEMDERANPFIPRGARIARKVHDYLLPEPSRRKSIKALFKTLEEMNDARPCPRDLSHVRERIEGSRASEAYKEALRELISSEYEWAERTGWLEWMRSCPALVPEKHHLLPKIVGLARKARRETSRVSSS
jgi:hypothetical protein